MTSTTWQDGLQRLLRRVDATGERVTDGLPHFGDPASGRWATSPSGDWTGGFWNGMCWLAAHCTGEVRYRPWAQQWTERLRPRAHSDTIFRGFLFYYGTLLGSVLLTDPLAREVAVEGAQGLAASFNPQAGVLPLGTEAEEASDVGRGESSIDGVQGAALLVWAAQELGDPSLRAMAVSHAHRHIEFCLRGDGSVCQSKPRQNFRYVYGWLSRPYSVARTPPRAYNIMRSDRESLSAGQVARTVAPYRGMATIRGKMGRFGGNRCGATMMGVHGFACRDKSDTGLFGAGGIVIQQTFLTPGAHAAPPGRVPVRPSPRTRQGCRRRWFVGTTSCRSLRPQTGCVSDLLRRHIRAGFARKSAGMGTSTIGSATTAPRAPLAWHDPRLHRERPTPDDYLIRYVKCLVCWTMDQHCSQMAVALGSCLYRYALDTLVQLVPACYPPYELQRIRARLVHRLQERFPRAYLFQGNHGTRRTRLLTVHDQRLVQQALARFTPWGTAHVPPPALDQSLLDTHFAQASPRSNGDRIHALINPVDAGLPRLIREYNQAIPPGSAQHLADPDTRLAIPRFAR